MIGYGIWGRVALVAAWVCAVVLLLPSTALSQIEWKCVRYCDEPSPPAPIYPPPPTYYPPATLESTVPIGPTPEELRRQEEEARRRAAEEARQRWLEDERQRAFARDRDETVQTLKGVRPVPLGMKGEPFDTGIKDLKPAHEVRDVSTAWKQLHCGTVLSLKAAAKAKQGDFDEASYLSEQAAQAIRGGSLGVQCPEAPPQPMVSAQKGLGLNTPQIELYKILLNSTNEQTERLVKAEQRVQELTERKKEADRVVAEKRQELERIKLKPADPKKSEKEKQKKEDGEAEKLLRKAEEDSRKAEEVRQKVVKDLTEATAENQQAEEIIRRNRAMFEQVDANPELAYGYLKQLNKQRD